MLIDPPVPDFSKSSTSVCAHVRDSSDEEGPPKLAFLFGTSAARQTNIRVTANGSGPFHLLKQYSDASKKEPAEDAEDYESVPVLSFVEAILERIKKPQDLSRVTYKAGRAQGCPWSFSNKSGARAVPWEDLQLPFAEHRTRTRQCNTPDDMPVLVIVVQEIGNLTSCIAQLRAFVLTVARMAGGERIWVLECNSPPVLINLYVLAQVDHHHSTRR